MRAQRITFIGILLTIAVAIPAIGQTDRVKDAYHQFSIVPPKGWEPQERSGLFMNFNSPPENGFRFNLGVSDADGTRTNLQKVVKELKDGMNRIMQDYQVEEEVEVLIDGKKGVLFTGNFLLRNNKFKNMMYIIPANGKFYNINCSFLSDYLDKYKAVVEAAAKSAKFED